ncbi:uncharacterized protein LOC126721396 [Quercus robur]|uniref:uncharacterized protein LOC126721396 n=1 Tax=Quercus robur TaxID=38942 RepID=UPI002162AD6F|nr:uncharacterized protein LOC126721396 [Quercus robur]
MDEAMENAMLNCGLNVCDNDSMSMLEGCPNNELLELLKTKKHARIGCSRHMTGDKSLFKSLKENVGNYVTFGDGSYAQVLSKWTVEILGLPLLKDVLYIKGLKANLLSITQICDEDFLVQFSKKGCIIIDEEGIQVLEGNRTTDNCYGVVPTTPISCRSARVDIEKSKACEKLEILCKRLQNEKGVSIVKIRSDHGKEFENSRFDSFCEKNGIKKEFSAPKTPQQNGVVERKNRVIQEMARVMLLKNWGEAVNTSCHIGNRIFFRVGIKKTAYEIWNGKKPKVKYLRVFGSRRYILNDRENLGKFDAKSDKGIFLKYSTTSRANRVFNKRTKTVMESINVEIDYAITKVEMVDDGEGLSKN